MPHSPSRLLIKLVDSTVVTNLWPPRAMLSNDVCPVIHPLVIQENLVSRFRYWNESIQEGMYFNSDLYTHFQSFSVVHRLNAYAVAYEQIEQGNTVCITASETCYIIWLCLRARASLKSVRGNLDFSSNDGASREKTTGCLGQESLSMPETSVALNVSHLPPSS